MLLEKLKVMIALMGYHAKLIEMSIYQVPGWRLVVRRFEGDEVLATIEYTDDGPLEFEIWEPNGSQKIISNLEEAERHFIELL